MHLMTGTEIAPRTPAGTLDLDRAERTLHNLRSAWESSLRTDSTRTAYRHDFGLWVEWLAEQAGAPHPLGAAFVHLEAWDRVMRDGGEVRPTTRARRLAAVASFYRYAVKAGVLDRNPADLVDRPATGPEHVKLTPALTEGEVGALVAAGQSAQDRALVLLLASTGLRVSEALRVTLDAITTERGHAVVTVTGKGGKVNTVPLVPMLAAEVADIAAERGSASGPLFLGDLGQPMTRQGAARALTRLAHRSGLGRPVSPHMLRASAITNALAGGVALDRVQRMVRHSDPRTTMRYNRAAEDLDAHPAYRLADGIAAAIGRAS